MNRVAEAFLASCRDEIEALKPGNVHFFADGHGMTAKDFLLSAEAAAAALCAPANSVGARILDAVEATWAAAGMNTNLGIVLLCAPLAAAAQGDPTTPAADLRAQLRTVLRELTREDAEAAFRAILRASPAGLGESPRHDVRGPADATLLEAMREAAHRDKIAYQYVSDFADVFGAGLEALDDARAAAWPATWATARVYFAFLSDFHDSHIARKHGAAAAAQVQAEARVLRARFFDCRDPAEMSAELLAFDRRLKLARLNPGTSADLTVATLFADRLTRILIQRRNDG